METRAQKIAYLKDLQAGKVVLPKPVKHIDIDLSPENLRKITRAELQEYLTYVNSCSKEQLKKLPYTDDQVFNALYNRIILECKIRLLKWINPAVLDDEDDKSIDNKFCFKNIANFGFVELVEEIGRRLRRKFDPQTDYPEISENEMKKFIELAPSVNINERPD